MPIDELGVSFMRYCADVSALYVFEESVFEKDSMKGKRTGKKTRDYVKLNSR